MMACVGCQFELHDQVTGVQFACRERGSRIILWMRTCDTPSVDSIRDDFSKALQEGLPDISVSLGFDNFAEKKAKSAAPRHKNRDGGNQHHHGSHGSHGGAGGNRNGGGSRYFS